ncbi:pyocin knob domain-containing S74 family peptidase [Pseudescherichia vulneris]|uniref:pyocin knob domain-containing S74 family peptidase n=1 Tax=Pseudescherichia vulneris TaxID=566 RepID=UPI0028AFDDF1|nr:pyocin knob domain-containing S74 family peptidase [Pseudescherichia vulneris]
MADIFSGNGLSLFYNADTGNRTPQSVNNVKINEVAAFPILQIQSNTKSFETYDSTYETKLLAEQDTSPLNIVVNYTGDESQLYLDERAKDQEEFQLIINYCQSEGMLDYAILNGAISSSVLSGDQNVAVTKTYTFQTTEVVSRLVTANSLLPLMQGDYGLGSNSIDVPQYETDTVTGNGFIKVPSSMPGNPASSDLLGMGLVDGSSTSALVMTKSGTLSIFAKNQSTAWSRIYTATQMDARYVPLTRTVNRKPLSTDILLTPDDVGAVPVERTVNGYVLSKDVVLSKGDVGLSEVQNAKQLVQASNLGDVPDAAAARSNLGLGTMATQNANQVTITGGNATFNSSANNPLTLLSANPTIKFQDTDTGSTPYVIVNDLKSFRIQETNTGGANVFSYDAGNKTSLINNLVLSNALSVESGGTGATTAAGARINLDVYSKYESDVRYVDGTGDTMTGQLTVPLNQGIRTATNGDMWASISSESSHAMLWRHNANPGVKADEFIGINGVSNLLFRQAVDESGNAADRMIYHTGYKPNPYDINAFYSRQNALTQSDNINNLDGMSEGKYYCAVNAYATAANGYPEQIAGGLLVLKNAANTGRSCSQFYYPFDRDVIWMRRLVGDNNGAAWTAWTRVYANTVAERRSDLGLGNSSVLNVGTYSGSVAAGDDWRLNSIESKTGGTINGIVWASQSNAVGVVTTVGGNKNIYLQNVPNEGSQGGFVNNLTGHWYNDYFQLGLVRSGDVSMDNVQMNVISPIKGSSSFRWYPHGVYHSERHQAAPYATSWNGAAENSQCPYYVQTATNNDSGYAVGLSVGNVASGGYNTRMSLGVISGGANAWSRPALYVSGDNTYSRAWEFTPYNGDITSWSNGFDSQSYIFQKNPNCDIRLKDEVDYTDGKLAFDNIMQIKPATYVYKADERRRVRRGVIAQDMQEIDPEYVKLLKFNEEMEDEETTEQLTLDSNPIMLDNLLATNYLGNLVLEQQKQIDELKALVQSLLANK